MLSNWSKKTNYFKLHQIFYNTLEKENTQKEEKTVKKVIILYRRNLFAVYFKVIRFLKVLF